MKNSHKKSRAVKSFLSLAVPTLGLAISVGLLTDYLDASTEIKSVGPADFQDIDEVQHLIHNCIEEARKSRYKDSQIMIDATGGMKTASIGAAVITLHNKVKFQYVNNDGNVLAYSMIFESHPYFSA